MNDKLKQELLDKNSKLIDMVIERTKRDFTDDIALIGLTGSFSTNDFHEKSDLDLIIVNNTDKAWQMAECFIFDDVGYDIYCTSWKDLEKKAILENPGVSSLIDLQIIYYSKYEYLERFNHLKEKALQLLAKPIGDDCLKRAKKHIDLAKQDYADALIFEDIGAIRYAAGRVLYNIVNAIVNLNNTYFKRGIKRYLEELLSYQYLPLEFETLYMAVIDAKTINQLRNAAFLLLKTTVELFDLMKQDFTTQPIATYDNLRGTYEELWCNYRNKIIVSTTLKDKSYAFHATLGAQNFLDEMSNEYGTKELDIMRNFDSDNLELLKDAFLQVMDEYLLEYKKVERKVLKFDTFEELYDYYMK